MKRGRKKLAGEKADAYDRVTLLHGRAPAAKEFAACVQSYARLKISDPHRAEFFGVSILDILSEVGSRPDKEQAQFFEDAAQCARARKDWGPDGVFDIRRLLLLYILKFEYASRPVELGKVAAQISLEGGVSVDERWVSRECKKLGYTVQRRGRR